MPCPAQVLGCAVRLRRRFRRGVALPRPAQMLGNTSPISHSFSIATAHVECGGLPPLYAVPAGRDVLQSCASTSLPEHEFRF
jgi:hypothetical protein